MAPSSWRLCTGAVAALLLPSFLGAVAYKLNPDSEESIKSVAKTMADDMLSFYNGDKPGGTPGLLPRPYYCMCPRRLRGDSSYNRLVTQGLLHQVGDHDDYMPRNQTLTEGNDDQGFWGLAVMSAAENNFPNPPADKPQWLGLAQAVFNTQAARWDEEHCGGGLRWQIFHWNKGFDYKNSISQACFFALGARLALYTGNDSYARWADRTWDWMVAVDFIDKHWRVLDGAHTGVNCTDIVPYQFTYNSGGFILGAAAMYNLTQEAKWKDRLDKLLGASKVFFTGPRKNIMTEVACEPVNRCNLDQQSFKAYLSRWLAAITKWAPHTYDVVMPYLRASAIAAAKQCTGGANGRMCGLKWNQDRYDGSSGIGQQMAAMEVTLSCMVKKRAGPVTGSTGGTSVGKPDAGGDDIGREQPPGPPYAPMTLAQRIGAVAATAVIVFWLSAGVFWILLDEASEKGPLQQIWASFRLLVALLAAGARVGLFHDDKGAEAGEGGLLSPDPLGSGHQQHQRLSSMPLGWPYNPPVRSGKSLVMSGRPPAGERTRSRQHEPAGGGGGSSSSSRAGVRSADELVISESEPLRPGSPEPPFATRRNR
ncbi:glycoside hydrolase family 76 protein [Ophiocordyceps camponoti-floridani]|uniref:mannan endo-1,6-alpha-mannosidase n=1 Tax=Ophiocordyceps camponoti-floridani TaxID=2030778 RepID=A0A8H4QD66_9HYPO|nr:glycoside hydrolase family 76 protein [Ophiocordyceps camponoti-floridani]